MLTWPGRTTAMFGIAPGRPCSMADFDADLHPEDPVATAAAVGTGRALGRKVRAMTAP